MNYKQQTAIQEDCSQFIDKNNLNKYKLTRAYEDRN
jgi:hypothetical protein